MSDYDQFDANTIADGIEDTHDELTALRERVERLEQALRGMIEYAASEIGLPPEECTGGYFAEARAALESK